jgi:hypothetical protein
MISPDLCLASSDRFTVDSPPEELAAYARAAGARARAAPTQVCEIGTVCAAAYSGSGQGCCPYEGAVCESQAFAGL